MVYMELVWFWSWRYFVSTYLLGVFGYCLYGSWGCIFFFARSRAIGWVALDLHALVF